MIPPQLIAASDHAGFLLKQHLSGEAAKLGCSFLDLGPFDENSVDYPDFVHLLAKALAERSSAMGLLICGSGNGVCMTANRYPFIRAALAWLPEIARLSRAHNDANVLCLPARFMDAELATQCLSEFVHTPFEEGRHANRVAKINPQP
jgi:ribose 5-phosphate isomerase B